MAFRAPINRRRSGRHFATAKAVHPDHAGPGGTAAFQDLTEAYEVLSDAVRRRHYDEQLRLAEEQPGAPVPVLRRPFQPEPFIPRANSLFRSRGDIRPSFEELFDRMVRNFTGAGAPKAERPEALNVEVVLSRPRKPCGAAICRWACRYSGRARCATGRGTIGCLLAQTAGGGG